MAKNPAPATVSSQELQALSRESYRALDYADGHLNELSERADFMLERILTALLEQNLLRREDLSVREFAETLGFEYDVQEEAKLSELVEPILQWGDTYDEHNNCPVLCGQCDEISADKLCESCKGAGGSAASGAWSECENCGGAGKIHENCEEITEALSAAERLRDVQERVASLHRKVVARYYGTDLNPHRAYDCSGCGEGMAWPCPTVRQLNLEELGE